MTDLAPVLAHLDADREGALARLFELLRFPSISTDPTFVEPCASAARWLANDLEGLGLTTRLVEGLGHPIVLGEGGAGAPHLLFYGHYDVQPVDPLELWSHDPFAPEIREEGGRPVIGARGAADDKGQVMTFLEALRAFKAVHGALPCRVTVLIEGEEESGGQALDRFLDTDGDRLKADLALVCDTTMWNAAIPAITTRLRGTCTEEVTVHAASRDLHSGLYGSAAANPIHELARALTSLRDDTGRITLAGFYDGVREIPESQRAEWDALGFDAGAFLGAVGLETPAGETDRSALEQLWSRPTAEVNGIWGGYTGAGFKTVIPAEAHAKVSFRLVDDQDPEAVRAAFRAHMRAAIRQDCRLGFTSHGGSRAITMDTSAPAFAAARAALSEEWGQPAAMIGIGGSIPVVGDFKRRLGMDSLLIGFGLEDDRMHSPNEKYDLASFQKGARAWARVLSRLCEAGA